MNSASGPHHAFRVWLLIATVTSTVWAYPHGAPPFACQNLDPGLGHGTSTATGPAPYEVTLSKSQCNPGETIQVTLSGTNGAKFKGFIIMGHRSGDDLSADPVGTFAVDDEGYSQLACTDSTSGNAVTHTNSSAKSSLTFQWTAPSSDVGDVVFDYSVVRGDSPDSAAGARDFFKQLTSSKLKASRNLTCSVNAGCYSNCVGDSCDWRIMFAPEGDKIRFDFMSSGLAGDHYVAFGLSRLRAMYVASVLSCQTVNGTVSVQASKNPAYDSVNLDDPSEGISSVVASYENGVLRCNFLRDRVSSNPWIFNSSQPWYFITARGQTTSAGVRMYHGSSARYHTVTAYSVEDTALNLKFPGGPTTPEVITTPLLQPGKFAKDSRCGTSMGCYSNCEDDLCDWQVMFAPDDDDNVRFDVKSTFFTDGKYVAFGFSQQNSMNPASVLTCQTQDGKTTVVVSNNKGYANIPLQNSVADISKVTSSFENGLLHCNFVRKKSSSNPLIYDLADDWFLITARGNLKSDGTLAYHGSDDRFKTDVKVSVQNVTFDSTFPSTRVATTKTPVPTTTKSAPIPSDEFKKDQSCGYSKGCFTNEVNGLCNWQITFASEGDNIRFDLKSTFIGGDAHYVAFGFSPQSGMNPASVLACQTQGGGAKVVASFNQNYDNKPLQDSMDGISNVTASYTNGLLQCNFLRVTTSSNPLMYNLTENWFLITARGAVNSDGSLSYHGTKDRFKTEVKVNTANTSFDETFPNTRVVTTHSTNPTTPAIPADEFAKDPRCGSTMGCFSNAENGYGNWQLMFGPQGDGVRFDFKSTFSGDAHYVALGFGPQSVMNPASVLGCLTQGGQAKVVASFNQNYDNKALQNSLDGITDVTASYENGLLHCNFLRSKTSVNPLVYNLTENWFFITARGVVNSDGSLSYHGTKDRFKTDVKVSTANTSFDQTFPNTRAVTTSPNSPKSSVKPDSRFRKDPDCGRTKACYSDCDDDMCTFLLSWKRKQPHFEISLKSVVGGSDNKWFAMGFSNRASMGDASVVECTVHNGKVTAFSSFNAGHSNQRLTPDSKEGISHISGSFQDGFLSCNFLRVISSTNPRIYSLDQPWYLVTARGNVDPNSGEKIVHTLANSFFTTNKLNFNLTNTDISREERSYPLVKLHGCLMIAAWILSASIGVAVARFFKPLSPDTLFCGVKVWFLIHRTAMSITFCLGVAAFIIIFVKVGGYSEIVGEDYKKAHPILGIIVTSLLVINPFMSLFRCAPDHPQRPLFNWAHFIVGTSAHILSAVTIAMGIYLPKAQLDGDKHLKVIIGYGCWQVVFFGLMTILDLFTPDASAGPFNNRTASLNDNPDNTPGAPLPNQKNVNYSSISKKPDHKPYAIGDSSNFLTSRPNLFQEKKSKILIVKNFLLVLHIGVLIAIAAYLIYSVIATDES